MNLINKLKMMLKDEFSTRIDFEKRILGVKILINYWSINGIRFLVIFYLRF